MRKEGRAGRRHAAERTDVPGSRTRGGEDWSREEVPQLSTGAYRGGDALLLLQYRFR